jgi:hypothetical protein
VSTRVTRCQGRVKRDGRQVVCGESVLWTKPDGDVFSAVVYDAVRGLEVGWCCAKLHRNLKEDFIVNFMFNPDADKGRGYPPGYERVPEEEPDRATLVSRARFTHALRDMGEPRRGGLRRLDGSEMVR